MSILSEESRTQKNLPIKETHAFKEIMLLKPLGPDWCPGSSWLVLYQKVWLAYIRTLMEINMDVNFYCI